VVHCSVHVQKNWITQQHISVLNTNYIVDVAHHLKSLETGIAYCVRCWSERATQWRKHAEFPKCCVQRHLRLWTLFKIQVTFIGIYCCQKCLYLGMTDFILRIYVAVTNNLELSTVIACACMWACVNGRYSFTLRMTFWSVVTFTNLFWIKKHYEKHVESTFKYSK